ncbi:MAG: hypothetical protein JO276_09150 [Sphingomonadaceae bacterium]|nr:hypothetical protein [Sphingomonadaceae bacterium]
MRRELRIEGIALNTVRELPLEDQDALLRFGSPISFAIGSATILAEFNRYGGELRVNLAHIDGGGEGVLLALWKLVRTYAEERGFDAIRWNVHALTCAEPNPKLQRFLAANGFAEVDDAQYGRIFMRRQML